MTTKKSQGQKIIDPFSSLFFKLRAVRKVLRIKITMNSLADLTWRPLRKLSVLCG